MQPARFTTFYRNDFGVFLKWRFFQVYSLDAICLSACPSVRPSVDSSIILRYAVCVCKLVIASLRPHHSTIFVTKSRFRNSYAVALNTDSVYMKTHHSRRNTFLFFSFKCFRLRLLSVGDFGAGCWWFCAGRRRTMRAPVNRWTATWTTMGSATSLPTTAPSTSTD